MASVECKNITTKGYNGGWKAWGTYGYAGMLGTSSSGYTYYVTQIKFTIPEYSEGDCTRQDSSDSTGLKFIVPYVCTPELSLPRAGTLYAKIYSSEVTGYADDVAGDVVTDYDTSASFSINDRYVHLATFNFGRKAPGTWYMIIYSSKCVQIGYNNTDGKKFSGTASYTPRSSVTAGTITINDNCNNTFTITATKGADGTNNPAGSLSNLKWGYTSSYEEGEFTNGNPITITRAGDANTRTVYATATTGATYGDGAVATKYVGINQYYPPNKPTKPALTDDSKKNGRVTIQQPWTFEWTCTPAVSASNSAIQGYRMYLYKWLGNNKTTTINMCDSNGNSLCNLWDGVYYRAQTAGSGTSLTFDPKKSGINPGDELNLRVEGYSFDGNSNRLYSAYNTSGYFTVENAGIVRVKHGSNWHEGQVYVKHGGNWHEAQAVYVKSGSNWHESN